jgi:hypothetical protein
MVDIIYNSFGDYLRTKGINVAEEFQYVAANKEITPQQANKQLNLIVEFHRLTMGYTGYLGKRLNNSTGKKVEEYKVHLKKFKRDYKRIHSNGVQSNFEELILKNGERYIDRAEKCIDSIFKGNYYGLLTRSMKRIEICLGNTYHTNLRRVENIEVVDLKHCGYNMVECDSVYYLGKLKRNGNALDWYDLIGQYCEAEKLGDDSRTFISAMIAFPSEVMRCYNRYKYRKKDWTEKEYEDRLLKAFERDGDSIL